MKNDFIFISVWELENLLCFKGFDREKILPSPVHNALPIETSTKSIFNIGTNAFVLFKKLTIIIPITFRF